VLDAAVSTAAAAPDGKGLLRIADDPTATVAARCTDVFKAFRTGVHPGDTAAQVGAVLGVPSWMGSDLPVNNVGGHVPVEMSLTDQTVVVMCLPKPNPLTNNLPWSPWVIYARIEGRTASTFGAFLASAGSKRLIEYALCHSPDRQRVDCEHFPKK
jgi:hypothetical protein